MGKHELRARELVSRMNIDEKIAQLCSLWLEVDGSGAVAVKSLVGRESPEADISEILIHGIGQLTRPYGSRPIEALECMKGLNSIQKHLIEHTRLSIPAMFHEECLAGVMAKGTTQFPTGLNYGAMWDPELVKRIGNAIGDELASLGVHQGLAPVLDVSRDVRWGRTEESMGEDPYLVGLTACSYITGFQGQDNSRIATLKHFLGHSASEGGRNHAPVHIGPRELYDVFALPFEMAVKLAKTGSVMPAYHDIDGEPCSASRTLLKTMLRDKWGFTGTIVSDYEALSQLCHDHHVASAMAEAAALGIKAGIDMDLPSDTCYRLGLKKALEEGLCGMSEIDACVIRILSQKSRIGLFEHPYGDEGGIQLNSNKNHALAIEAAVGSLVLLHNDGTLPLHDEKRIALIGPLADDPYAMYAGYAFPTHLMGSYAQEDTIPRQSKTIREALEALIGRERLVYAKGCDILTNRNGTPVVFPGEVVQEDVQRLAPISDDKSNFADALKAVCNADVAVVVLGDLAGLFQNGTVGEGSDTSSFVLPGVQQELLDAILAKNIPTIVVLVSGRPYYLGDAHKRASAIIATWMPGEGGGEAVAGVLMGKSSPKGRLPISYVTNAGAMPYVYNHPQKSSGVPIHPDYKSLYPFGFGLTYGNFTYGDCSIDSPIASSDCGEFIIRCMVHNEGYRDAEEVIQLYVKDVCASKVRPVKELKGFKRVPLDAQQSAQIIFKLPVDVLGFCVSGFDRTVEPGEFEIQLGNSAEHVWFVAKVLVTGVKRVLPKKWRMITEATVNYC